MKKNRKNKTKRQNLIMWYIDGGLPKKYSISHQYKVRFFNIVALLGFLILATFGFINFRLGNTFFYLLEFSLAGILAVASLQLRYSKSLRFASHVAIFVIFIMVINNYMFGGFELTGHYWSFIFPVAVFILVGTINGVYYTLFLYFILSVLQMAARSGLLVLPYTEFQNYMFLIVLGSMTILVGLYEAINERVQNEIAEKTEELRHASEVLKEEFNAKKLVSKKLDKHLSSLEEKNILLEDTESAILNILEDVEEERINTQAEKERLNTIIQSIGDGVLVLDQDQRIVMLNESTELITGFAESDLLGMTIKKALKFVTEKDEKENYDFIDQVYKTGTVSQIPKGINLIRKDEERIPVGDSSSPIKDSKGHVLGCVVVFRDISKEREIDRMKSEFVSISSHQLRTPLTGIRWYLELLKDTDYDKLSDDQREFFERIEESNNRMIKLVEDLLNVSRIETGRKFSIEKRPIDIINLIHDNIDAQAIHAKKKQIKIEIDKSMPKNLELQVDPDKITQVINNLISNAIKYSPEKTTVVIGYKKKKDEHIFSVKDQGAGIPNKDQKNIFQKFFRADNIKRMQVEGSGLGLYIIKAIIEGHDGKAWFESKVNKGSTFYFSLK